MNFAVLILFCLNLNYGVKADIMKFDELTSIRLISAQQTFKTAKITDRWSNQISVCSYRLYFKIIPLQLINKSLLPRNYLLACNFCIQQPAIKVSCVK